MMVIDLSRQPLDHENHRPRKAEPGIRDSLVSQFIATMPKRYLVRHSLPTVRAHARIAYERGTQLAHAGRFNLSGEEGGPALCVVAQDAVGLLAAISTSLMLEGFDIMDAEAYTRRMPGGSFEAVDLFWVRREQFKSSLTDEDAAAVKATLTEILRQSPSLRTTGRKPGASTPGAAETRVRFVEHPCEPHLTLELETKDRPGLLMAITGALAAENVLITGSQIATHGQRVHDSFDIVEADGARVSGDRLQRIQLAVLGAVDNPEERL